LAAAKEKADVARELQKVGDEIGGVRSAGEAESTTNLPRTWSNARTACAHGYRPRPQEQITVISPIDSA
jgi:hypothetical protein